MATRAAPRVDWSDWSFGPGRHPVSGAAIAAFSAWNATAAASLAGLPWWVMLVAGVVLAASATIVAAWQSATRPVIVYRVSCWLAAGVWSAVTLAVADPWTRWTIITLLVGTIAVAIVGTGLAWAETKAKERAAQSAAPAVKSSRDPRAKEWEARILGVARVPVAIVEVRDWNPPTGYTLFGELPADGTTVAYLKGYEANLAAAADLPPGCNVEVMSTSGGRRKFAIHVAIKNVMAETHHLPPEHTPLSINDPLVVGFHSDGKPATIHLRFACGVLVGQTGSGKSNVLNVVTHQLVRCPDTLVWAVDLSGKGRFPRPWVRAYKEGRAPVPAIDWVAATEEEAQLMLTAAIQVINGRTAAYEQLLADVNDDKIPASPALPQILILLDEFGTLPDSIKDLVQTISDTGRGAAVRTFSCALEATSAYIPRQLITQARERIGMRVSDEQQLQYLFDLTWSRGRFDPASIPYEGSGLIASGATPPQPFKAYRLEPDKIDAAAVAVASLRPRLDDASAQLAETVRLQARGKYGELVEQEITGVYSGRWDRMLPVMFPGKKMSNKVLVATATAAATAKEGTSMAKDVDMAATLRDLDAALEAARKVQEEARIDEDLDLGEAEETASGATTSGEGDLPPIDPDALDWSLVDRWLAEARGEQPDSRRAGERVPPQRRVLEIVQEHRRDGIGPRAVWQRLRAEGYGTAEQTVITWMGRFRDAGVLSQPGGKGSPYVPGPRFKLE